MRAPLRLLLLSVVVGFSAGALAQEAEPVPAGPPTKDLIGRYRGPMDEQPKSPGIGLMGVTLLVGVSGVVFLVMAIWYRRTTKELGLAEDEAELELETAGVPSPSAAPGSGGKESVFGVLVRSGGWVTPGRVAVGSGLDVPAVEAFLEDLVGEGRVKAGRDKSGRVLYRTAA